MHDEFRGSLARQGITEEAYLKAVDKTGDDLHAEFRPNAEKRAKTLLVLSKVADAEGLTVPDADVEAEVAQGRERYAGDAKLQDYFESERGRVVHPEHPAPQPRRRAPHRRVARGPPRPSAPAAPRGHAGIGGRRRSGPGQRGGRGDRPRLRPRRRDSTPVDEPATAG